jgi:hypothetical protein
MRVFDPDGFTLLLFESPTERFVRIFAAWRDHDRWRLISGATDTSKLRLENGKYLWEQISGNCYLFDGEEGGCYFASPVDPFWGRFCT